MAGFGCCQRALAGTLGDVQHDAVSRLAVDQVLDRIVDVRQGAVLGLRRYVVS